MQRPLEDIRPIGPFLNRSNDSTTVDYQEDRDQPDVQLWGDRAEQRSLFVERLGEPVVEKVESALRKDVRSEGVTADITQADDTPHKIANELESIITRGYIDGMSVNIQRPDECPDAVFRGPPEIPVYENPQRISNEAAWIDLCFTTESWMQLMTTAFDGPPAATFFSGLAPSSIEYLRNELQAGETVPRGTLEMEYYSLVLDAADGEILTGLEAKDQEGRNRSVAALLEGHDHVIGRIIARPER